MHAHVGGRCHMQAIGLYLERLGPFFGLLFMTSVIALGILLVATFAVQLVRSYSHSRHAHA